jgi:hypothetical protein
MRSLVVATLLLAATVTRAESAPSLAELTHRLLAETLAPVLEVAQEHRADPSFALRTKAGGVTASGLLGGYADYLLERGSEVFELGARDEPSGGALLLEITPLSVGVEFGPTRSGFLGFGRARSERTASLHVRLRLSDPESGQLLYDQERSARRVDFVPEDERDLPVSGDPLHVASSTASSAAVSVPRAGWLERGVAVGLLGGIILIYFAGSS